MPRQTMTRAQRATNVDQAILALPALFAAALKCEGDHGATDPRTLRAWEAVEVNGATVHRQARLLAGKSRGG